MEENWENHSLLSSIVIINPKHGKHHRFQTHLSIWPSSILCIWLSQKYWFKFDETWRGYPLEMRNWLDFEPCQLISKVIWVQKVANQNHPLVPKTVQTSHPILMKLHGIMHWRFLMKWLCLSFWGMWPNLQGHWGQIGQICGIWTKGDFHKR